MGYLQIFLRTYPNPSCNILAFFSRNAVEIYLLGPFLKPAGYGFHTFSFCKFSILFLSSFVMFNSIITKGFFSRYVHFKIEFIHLFFFIKVIFEFLSFLHQNFLFISTSKSFFYFQILYSDCLYSYSVIYKTCTS